MSVVFEGILISGQVSEDFITAQIPDNPVISVVSLENDLFLLYKDEVNPIFSEEIDSIAQNTAMHSCEALAIRYNNKTGIRQSIFYDSTGKKTFGKEEEIYVLLDDEGEPLRDGKQFKYDELDTLDDEEEYETLYNAIELGLIELNISPKIQREIFKIINNTD
jgi:hypothetical protein